jgi:chromosome segregation ATPase
MKNRWLAVIALVITVIVVFSGCGISQTEYDAVAIELNLVNQDRQNLQAQLQQAQSQTSDAKADLIRAQVELETTREQLEKTQSDLDTAQGQIDTIEADRQTALTQFQETQDQLATALTDLASAQAQIQSLQNDLNAALVIPAEALSYAEFMDIVMYEVWLIAGITPNYTFATAGEYQAALKNRLKASVMRNYLILWLK